MTLEQAQQLFLDEEAKTEWKGDNAFQGLSIIAKYFSPDEKDILVGADHDEIYSVDLEELLEAGITDEDLQTLRRINWSYDEDGGYLRCFV